MGFRNSVMNKLKEDKWIEHVVIKLRSEGLNRLSYTTEKAISFLQDCVAGQRLIGTLIRNESKVISMLPDASDCKEKKIADILSGKHDNDFIDKEKFQRNSYYLAYHKATEMLNWAELSRTLAGDRSSITKERIPQKHIQKIDELRKLMSAWILENDPQFNR